MFCPKCGNKLVDGAIFCSSCGNRVDAVPGGNSSAFEPVQEKGFSEDPYVQDDYYENDAPNGGYETDIEDYYQDEPAPKKSKKPLIITLCAVAAAAVIFGVVFASGAIGGGSPETRLKNAAQKTSDAISGRSEVTTFFKEMKKSDKFGVSVTLEDIGNMLSSVSPYMSYLNLDAQIDAAADKKGNLSATMNVEAFGTDINAGIYTTEGGEKDIVFDMPSVLKDPYGISLKTAADDLDSSVLSPNSDSDYSLPDSEFDSIKEALESANTMASAVTEADIRELTDELQKNEDTKIELVKSKAETDAGDGTVKCDVYTASIDEEKLAAIIDYFGRWFAKRVDLENNEIAAEALRSMGLPSTDPEDLFNDIVREVKDTDVDLSLEYYVYKGYLVKTSLSGEISGHELRTDITFGSNPAKTDKIVLEAEAEGSKATAKLDLSKAEQNVFNFSLKSKENDINVKVGFEYDADESEFKLTATNADGDNVVFTGGMKVQKDSMTISDPMIVQERIGKFKLDGLTIRITKDPVIKKLKDDYPDGYTNVLRLDQDELLDIIQKVSSLGSTLGSLFG